MAQWVNHLRNNIFVNPPPLPLLCEISGALHASATGSYSRLAGRQAGRQADEIQVNFEIFKVGCRSKYSTCRFVLPRYSIITALPMQSSRFFRVKPIGRLFYEVQKIGKPYNFLPIPTIKYYRT